MTHRPLDLSPAERIAFTWNRAPEARWITWEELAKGDQDQLLLWAGGVWSDTNPDYIADLGTMLYFSLGERGEAYEPLKEDVVLFREFAALSGDPDSLQEFARRFGPLDAGEWHRPAGMPYVSVYYGNPSNELSSVSGLEFWQTCHAEMRDAVDFFDGLTHRAEPDLLTRAREFVWDPNLARTPREEVQAALSLLVERHKPASPTLAGDGTLQGTGLRLTYGIGTLLEAMWLQLTLAVDGNRRYDSCKNCGKWWDATHAHSKKKTCSDACRRALHRRQQKEQTERGEGQ